MIFTRSKKVSKKIEILGLAACAAIWISPTISLVNKINSFRLARKEITHNYNPSLSDVPKIPRFSPIAQKDLSPFFLLADQIILGNDRQQYTDFFKQKDSIDSFLAQTKMPLPLQERIDSFNTAITFISKIKDPLIKCRAISCLTNLFFAYDETKLTTQKHHKSYRLESFVDSFQDMFIGGDGNGVICGDRAVFSGILAIKTGFAPRNTLLFHLDMEEIETQETYPHTFLVIKTQHGPIIIQNGTPNDELAALKSLKEIVTDSSWIELPSRFFSPQKNNKLFNAVNMDGQVVIFKQDTQFAEDILDIPSSVDDDDMKAFREVQSIAAEIYVRRSGVSADTTANGRRAALCVQDTYTFFSGTSNFQSLILAIVDTRKKSGLQAISTSSLRVPQNG